MWQFAQTLSGSYMYSVAPLLAGQCLPIHTPLKLAMAVICYTCMFILSTGIREHPLRPHGWVGYLVTDIIIQLNSGSEESTQFRNPRNSVVTTE